jgi:hypothetical protein
VHQRRGERPGRDEKQPEHWHPQASDRDRTTNAENAVLIRNGRHD